MASLEIQSPIKSGALNGWSRHSMLAFEETAAVLDLEPWIVQRFRHSIEESTAYLQIPRDSGEAVCLPLLVVHHSEMSGCAVGSLSLAPGLQLRDCQVVAMERTWQSALVGLPYGGASFGLVCEPSELSEKELIGMVRPLARRLRRESGDVLLFPGVGCCREFLGRLSTEIRDSHTVRLAGKPPRWVDSTCQNSPQKALPRWSPRHCGRRASRALEPRLRSKVLKHWGKR